MKVVFKIIYLLYTTYRQKRIHETILPLGNFRTPKRKSLLSNFLYFFILLKRDGASRPFLLYKGIGLQKYRSPVFSEKANKAYRTFHINTLR